MQSQVTCPACHTQFVGDLYQIIDVGQNPELKELLLSGYLNVVQCPNCGSVTQVGTPFLYHDPQHDLFMVHVPMEMNLSHDEQQKVIGQLVRTAMDSLPAEQRRGYMLQPQTIISLQTLLEKVLETEGITPEMIAHQRSQSELLQQLLSSDKNVALGIIRDREDEIDETFIALLRTLIESAEQGGQDQSYLDLINLQALLYRETEFGQQLERQQKAIHLLSRDAKKEGGVSQKLLLQHVLANRGDMTVVDALVMAARPALDYEFFVLLSERIEKRQKSGIDANELLALREHLLELQQEFEKRSREVVAKAQSTLDQLLQSADKPAAVRAILKDIDDLFMMVLSSNLEQAEQLGDTGRVEALREVQNSIVQEMEDQAPPEFRLVNQLLSSNDDATMRQLLDENEELIDSSFLELIQAISGQAGESNDKEIVQRLGQIESLVVERL